MKYTDYKSIDSFMESFDNTIRETNACADGHAFNGREKFDLFYYSIPDYQKKEISLQNCTDIETAITIIERLESNFKEYRKPYHKPNFVTSNTKTQPIPSNKITNQKYSVSIINFVTTILKVVLNMINLTIVKIQKILLFKLMLNQ